MPRATWPPANPATEVEDPYIRPEERLREEEPETPEPEPEPEEEEPDPGE